jgi:hypothetical protein
MYFIHTNTDTQVDWQYGYKEAIEYVNSSDRRAYFSNNVEQGYIFYLFYSGIDPYEYIRGGGSSRTKQNCYLIDKAYFGTCNKKIQDGDIFITTLPLNLKEKYRLMHSVEYFDGKKAVYIYERTSKKKLWTK